MQIDLSPKEYRVIGRIPRLSKTLSKWLLCIAIAWLGYFGTNASNIEPVTLFAVATMFGFFAGVLAAEWLKDIY